MDIIREQFAGHETLFKAGGAEAREQVEILEVRKPADEWVQVVGEWHPTGPRAPGGKISQEREEFDDMRAVGLDA